MENNSSPSQTSRSPPPKYRPSQTGLINPQEIIPPPQTKRKSKENLGFIDKHIIRPIRGGFFLFILNIFNKFNILLILKLRRWRCHQFQKKQLPSQSKLLRFRYRRHKARRNRESASKSNWRSTNRGKSFKSK